jgi:2-polyprenyl-6-methoxyphenol hydroxylase-like FAD-dependent oxidoreductase
MIDVLVVGGGPAGLATAICCARAGLSVTVAEPRAAPVDKACGEGLLPSAVRRLDALGVPLGIPSAPGHQLRGIRYTNGTDQADALFSHGTGLGVRRTVLHAALAGRAAALGVRVLPARVPAGTVTQAADRVIADGVEARYLVAADGLHSAIRRACTGGGTGGGTGDRAGRRAPRLPWPGGAAPARYGLRRHYRIAPWTDLVEVHWARGAEAYVTPVAEDTVGIALLFSRASRGDETSGQGDRRGETREPGAERGAEHGGDLGGDLGWGGGVPDPMRGGGARGFEARLAAFPALCQRLAGAAPASAVRGAGPLRQDVGRRVHGRVLLVGDASGYLDALTGEGIGVALAQASALAACLSAGRPADYERAWRQVSGPAWRLTAGLLWSRNRAALAPLIVPAAARLPWLFRALVNQAAEA